METWDAYKEDESFAGLDLLRGKAIPKGLFHLVSEVVVKHTDGMYLLMQRDWKKPNFPGLYEASAGGSALKGEGSYDAAIRELKEETGIEAKELTKLYKFISHDTIYFGYLCETDCDKSFITLQKGETVSHQWLTTEKFLKFVQTDMYLQPHKERMSEYLDSIR